MIKRMLIIVIGLIIVISFIGYCIAYRQKLSVLFEVKPIILSGIILLVLVHRGSLALRFRSLCRPYGAKVPFKDAYLLVLISSAINLVSPIRGGFATRALYLKKNHGLLYAYIPSLIIGSTILSFIVGGILIICANIVCCFMGEPPEWFLWWFGVALCSFSLLFIIKTPSFLSNLPGKPGEKIKKAFEGWDMMRRDVKSLGVVCGFHLIVILLSTIIIIICFYAVNLQLSVPVALSISVFNSFTGVINLTPANLGIQEWATAFIGNLSGFDFHSGVAAALISRAAGILVNIIGGIVGYYFLFIKTQGSREENGEI